MNQIITVNLWGKKRPARLLTASYGDKWNDVYMKPTAYVSGMRYEWFEHVNLCSIVSYLERHNRLKNRGKLTLCSVAHSCYREDDDILKGWAALMLLIKKPAEHTDMELSWAIMAAEKHCKTLVGRNALKLFEIESDKREFGRWN